MQEKQPDQCGIAIMDGIGTLGKIIENILPDHGAADRQRDHGK
jgi:hypothetical protein